MEILPKYKDIPVNPKVKIERAPSKTYKIDLTTRRIVGKVDGKQAVEQAVFKILQTERYDYLIYDWNYGVEMRGLIGRDESYVKSEIKRRIKEALIQDDRVKDVSNFNLHNGRYSDSMRFSFNVNTIYGDINTGIEVIA